MLLLSIVLIITSILNVVALYGHYWLLNRAMARQHEQITQELQDFITGTDGYPSPFAQLTGQFIDSLASSVMMRFKTTFMGQASAAAHQGREVLNALTEDTNPVVGALADAFPHLGKILRKRPETLQALTAAMSKVPTHSGNGSSPSTTAKFNL